MLLTAERSRRKTFAHAKFFCLCHLLNIRFWIHEAAKPEVHVPGVLRPVATRSPGEEDTLAGKRKQALAVLLEWAY
jgi:hypothetical protein